MNKKKGFTIVELVIVIAVIAILAAVLIPTFQGVVEKAKNSKRMQDDRNRYLARVSESLGDGKMFCDSVQHCPERIYSEDEVYKCYWCGEPVVIIIGDKNYTSFEAAVADIPSFLPDKDPDAIELSEDKKTLAVNVNIYTAVEKWAFADWGKLIKDFENSSCGFKLAKGDTIKFSINSAKEIAKFLGANNENVLFNDASAKFSGTPDVNDNYAFSYTKSGYSMVPMYSVTEGLDPIGDFYHYDLTFTRSK